MDATCFIEPIQKPYVRFTIGLISLNASGAIN